MTQPEFQEPASWGGPPAPTAEEVRPPFTLPLVILVAVVAAGVGGMFGYAGRAAQEPNGGRQYSPQSPVLAAAPEDSPAGDRRAVSLLVEDGTGTQGTQRFTTAGEWALQWSYNCNKQGGSGVMQVYLLDASGSLGDVLVNTVGAFGSDTTYQQTAGTFSLKVNASCDWHLEVLG